MGKGDAFFNAIDVYNTAAFVYSLSFRSGPGGPAENNFLINKHRQLPSDGLAQQVLIHHAAHSGQMLRCYEP